MSSTEPSSSTSTSSDSSSSPYSSSANTSSSLAMSNSSPSESSPSSEKKIYVTPPLRQAYESVKASARPTAPVHRPASPTPIPKSSPATSSTPVRPATPFAEGIKVVKGCFYYHNKYSPSNYTHRNKCPWFRLYLSEGVCHLNEYGELCLRPRRPGAERLPF
jgi:hypothetical protein